MPFENRATSAASLGVMLIMGLSATAASGQRLLTDAECPSCCIALNPVLTTRGSEQEPIPGLVRSFGALSENRFALTFAMQPDVPFELSADGHLRRIGREGRGPGEYVGPTFLTTTSDSDSIYVADARNARLSVLSPDGSFVRSFRILPLPVHDLAVLEDGSVVIAAGANTPALAGRMLHSYGPGGTPIADFGEVENGVGTASGADRRAVAASDGRVWSLHPGQYRIDEWSADGSRLGSFSREAPRFEAHQHGRPIDGEGHPVAFAGGLEVEDDTAIVLVVVPDARWEDHRERRRLGNREVEVSTDLDKTFDTIVEFIDLSEGAVIASRRFDPALGLISRRFIARGPTPQDLDAVFRVWSAELRPTPCGENE